MTEGPVTPGFSSPAGESEHVRRLESRLERLERFLQPFRDTRLNAVNESGETRIYEVLGRPAGSATGSMLPPLAPIFGREGEKLFVQVNPHLFLAPDQGDRLMGVIPTLDGKPINDDPPPKKALADGEWFQVLYMAAGKAKVDFVKEMPKRENRYETQEIVLLAEFTIKDKAVAKIEVYSGSLPLETRRPGGFAPLLWYDEEKERWDCKVVPGHIRDMRTPGAGTEAVEWSGEVKAGEVVWLKVDCQSDGSLPKGGIHKQEEPGESKDYKPPLSDQSGQAGVIWLKLFELKADEDRVYPVIHWQGDIPWWPQSFANLGGHAELLKDTESTAGKLRVRGITGSTLTEPEEGCLGEFEVMAQKRANDVLLRVFPPSQWECLELKVCIDGYPQTRRFIVLPAS